MTQILLRRATSQVAASNNPILANGEPGYEQDTGLLKVGDGITHWVNLPSINGGGGGSGELVTESGHEGFSFRIGSGPLPDPESAPDTLYLLLPAVADVL